MCTYATGMGKTLTPRERLSRDGVRVRLPDGRAALMWTGIHPTRGRIVLVKPIREKETP